MSEDRDERIDGLVRDAEGRAWDDAPVDEVTAARDRAAVLARIRSNPIERRTPWWRAAAPIAVAASLVGLFVLRDQLAPTGEPALETKERIDRLEEPIAAAPGRDEDSALPSADEREGDAGLRKSVAFRQDAADAPAGALPPPSVPVESLGRATSLAEREEAADDRLTLVDDVAFRVDAALDLLGTVEEPRDVRTAVRDSLLEVLRDLRPRVVDATRARRVDAWIAPRE